MKRKKKERQKKSDLHLFLLRSWAHSPPTAVIWFDDAVTVIFLVEISLKACNESSKGAWFVFFLFVFGADCYDEFAQIFIQLLWRYLFKFSFLVFRC